MKRCSLKVFASLLAVLMILTASVLPAFAGERDPYFGAEYDYSEEGLLDVKVGQKYYYGGYDGLPGLYGFYHDFWINGKTAYCCWSNMQAPVAQKDAKTKYIIGNHAVRAKALYYFAYADSNTPTQRNDTIAEGLPTEFLDKNITYYKDYIQAVIDYARKHHTISGEYDYNRYNDDVMAYMVSHLALDDMLNDGKGVRVADGRYFFSPYSDLITAVHKLVTEVLYNKSVMSNVPNVPDNLRVFYCFPDRENGYNNESQGLISIEEIPTGGFEIQKKSANPEITDGNECYNLKDAEFTIYSDKALTKVVKTVKTDKKGYADIDGLKAGTYYVKETVPPKGYEISTETFSVTVKAGDKPADNVLPVPEQPGNDPAVLSIYKNDPDHVEKDEHGNDVKKPIPGVEFEICYYDADPTTTLTLEDLGDKTPKRTWVIKTDSNGGAALGNKWKVDGSDDFYYQYNAAGQPFGNAVVPIGCLTLTEKQEAPGYYKDTTVRFARVTEDMAKNNELIKFSGTALTNDSIDYPNYETETHVSKKDITTQEEKPGAHLKVTDKDDAVVDSWISTDEEHIIKGLTVGETYTLTETLAPDGYVTSSDVTFTVLDGGKVTTVIMYDDITKYEFIKVDENGKPLTGAVLKVEEVSDREGKFVEEWTTDGTAHKIYGKLVVGRTYTFSEVKAPAGYVLAEPETFVVENNPKVHTLTAENVLTETRVSKKSITTMEELSGAELAVTDKDDKKVDKWISTDEEHIIKGLIPGETYTLTETLAPDGYVISNSIQFTVNTDGTVTKVEMVDDTTKFEFIKVNSKGEPVADCILRIEHFKGVYAVDAATPDEIVNQEVWEPVEGEEWTTDEEGTPHVVHAKLVVGERYRLVEVSAPEDYALAKPVEFTVENTAETVEIKMVNTVTSVTKTDINGDKEVPGATLIVRDKDGNIVDQWVSTDEAHHVKNLTVGETYTLEESIPAPGYVTADPIGFTVTEDGVDTDLTMKDAPTKVVVRKLDDSNKPVKGAKLQLLDKDKKVIDEWVSDGTDHLIEGKLVVGETYTLHEVSAPTGYELAKDIEFTVKDTADKQEIRMVDVYKVSTPDQPTSPPNSGTVKSGQGTWGLMIAVGVILLSVACVAFFRRKKENEI